MLSRHSMTLEEFNLIYLPILQHMNDGIQERVDSQHTEMGLLSPTNLEYCELNKDLTLNRNSRCAIF
jgi:hypothetical protein